MFCAHKATFPSFKQILILVSDLTATSKTNDVVEVKVHTDALIHKLLKSEVRVTAVLVFLIYDNYVVFVIFTLDLRLYNIFVVMALRMLQSTSIKCEIHFTFVLNVTVA